MEVCFEEWGLTVLRGEGDTRKGEMEADFGSIQEFDDPVDAPDEAVWSNLEVLYIGGVVIVLLLSEDVE